MLITTITTTITTTTITTIITPIITTIIIITTISISRRWEKAVRINKYQGQESLERRFKRSVI